MEGLIKREDAIEELADYMYEIALLKADGRLDTMEHYLNRAKAMLKRIPSADRPTWNPCSERLPEATGFYICTVNRELFDVRTMKFEMLAEGGYRWLLRNGLEVFPSFVLAWMPLPKPWKGADDE